MRELHVHRTALGSKLRSRKESDVATMTAKTASTSEPTAKTDAPQIITAKTAAASNRSAKTASTPNRSAKTAAGSKSEQPRPLRPASARVPPVLESAVMHRQSLPHPSSGQLPARRHARRRHWKHTPSFSQRANGILWPVAQSSEDACTRSGADSTWPDVGIAVRLL